MEAKMDAKAMYALSYGLFVVTAREDGFDNGCITNTVAQVTTDPNRITLAVNKQNLTHDMIVRTKRFTASVISESATFELFRRFGFQSGRDVNKFDSYAPVRRMANGNLAVLEGTCAVLCGEVESCVDLGTHTLFVARVTEMEVLTRDPAATYAYYHAHIKPKPEAVGKTEDGQTVWRCRICGYEYVGEELPEDFICPLCKHPASDFEKVVKKS